MPNWKSYESSVRLLSAILAAHPELKLNYAAISRCFGGDCTTSALENRFRRIKTDSKAIRDCVANGIDPITLPVEGGRMGDGATNGSKEMAKYIGDCSAHAVIIQFTGYRKEARRLTEEFAANGACQPPEIAKLYGEECTPKAMMHRCTNAKKDAHALREEYEEIAKYYEDCTESSLDHRFRPIKKDAQAMRQKYAAGGIAGKYGEEVTAKAVSTRFERLKKEPHWLGNEAMIDANKKTANGVSNGSSGGAVKTPKKKKATKADSGNESDGDDAEASPSKKGALNKVKVGRVTKRATPRKTNSQALSYAEAEEDEEVFKQEEHDVENGFYFQEEDINMTHHDEHFYDSQE